MAPLLAPDPLHPRVLGVPTLNSQAPVDQPPAPEEVTPGQVPDPLPQLVPQCCPPPNLVAVGGAILARQRSGTALRPWTGLRCSLGELPLLRSPTG